MREEIKTIFFSVLFFSLLLFSVLVLWPTFKQISNQKEEIIKLEKHLSSLKAYSEKIDEEMKRIKERETEIEKIAQILPKKENPGPLFSFLQKSAAEAGLVLTELSFSKNFPEGEEKAEIMISLELHGTYSSFKNFISKVENSLRIFEPEKISIKKPEGKSDVLDIKVELKTFTF